MTRMPENVKGMLGDITKWFVIYLFECIGTRGCQVALGRHWRSWATLVNVFVANDINIK
jgi:hypothetical protein